MTIVSSTKCRTLNTVSLYLARNLFIVASIIGVLLHEQVLFSLVSLQVRHIELHEDACKISPPKVCFKRVHPFHLDAMWYEGRDRLRVEVTAWE